MSLNAQQRVAATAGLLTLLVALSAACVTTVKEEEIPADLSAAIFFQRAQEYVDQEQWSAAVTYLKTFKQRFPDDLAHNIEADYLIAQIDYKQGKLSEARAKYQALLDRYSQSDAASLPPAFKILAQRLVERIDAKDPDAKNKATNPSPNPSASPSPQPDATAAK